ncbi:MAG: hypothetical protein Q9205_007657 [Flavoplaca limonia]
MKFTVFMYVLFGAIPLVIGAHPVAAQLQQQQIPLSPIRSPSSINSTSKARLMLDRLKLKPTSKFQCHSYPQDNTLSELALDIADLLRKYRDQLFVGMGRIPIDTCHAGYDANKVSPSIILTTMNGRQADILTKLLNNLVVNKFPTVKMVNIRSGVALVQEKGTGIRRRATI